MDFIGSFSFPLASGYALFLWGLSVMIYRSRRSLYFLFGGWFIACVVRSIELSSKAEAVFYPLSMAICSCLVLSVLSGFRGGRWIGWTSLAGSLCLYFPGCLYLGGGALSLSGLGLFLKGAEDRRDRRVLNLIGAMLVAEGTYVLVSPIWSLSGSIPLLALLSCVGYLMHSLFSDGTVSPRVRSVLRVGLISFSILSLLGVGLIQRMEDDFRKGLLREGYRRLEMTKGKFVFFEMMGVAMAKTVASDPIVLSAFSGEGVNSDIQLRIVNRRLGSSIVYLLDKSGAVISTSDPSLRGENFAFRRYFTQAISGQNGLLYAMGSVTGKVGAYFSRPLVDSFGQVIGVAVVKMDLEPVFGEVFRSDSIFMSREGQVLMGPSDVREPESNYLSVSMPLPGVCWSLIKLIPVGVLTRYTRILISFYVLLSTVVLLALFRYVQREQLIGELQREVQDRQAAEASERKARAEAEEANRAKSGFLANMSHEIRTPLNAVLGMAGLLLDTELDQRQSHYARIIQTSGESLLGLINDILDFSKIEAEKMELESLDFDLQALLEDVVEILSQRAEEKGIYLDYLLDRNVPRFLRGDPVRIRQVLVNLVGNGVKFTSQGSVRVKVSLYSSVGDVFNVRFSVVDTGIGIPPDRAQSLFNAFEQVDSTTTRRFGGTGLGLAISKRLTELMGGRIGVNSQEGAGSDFWLVLPMRIAVEEVREERFSRESLIGKKVLLVDDTSDNLLVLSERLGGWGMITESCSSPQHALDIVLGDPSRFDLAILDVQMPDIDGFSLAKSIREISSVPMIFLSSIGDQVLPDRIRDLDGCSWLIKPARTSSLLRSMISLLQKGDSARTSGSDGKGKMEHKGRLLLVEDNEINQQVATALLYKMGYICEVASNGKEAVEMFRPGDFQAILMDIEMPVMDGFEATASIREIEGLRTEVRIPIIAMTAHAISGYKERCIAAGMDDYVTKPISPKQLRSVLDTFILEVGFSDVDKKGREVLTVDGKIDDGKVWRDRPVFDQADGLASVGDDPEFLMEMLVMFNETYGTKHFEIRDMADRGAWAEGGAAAHTFKGAAGNLGLLRLRGCASWAESYIKGSMADGVLNEDKARNVLLVLADEVESTCRFAAQKGSEGIS